MRVPVSFTLYSPGARSMQLKLFDTTSPWHVGAITGPRENPVAPGSGAGTVSVKLDADGGPVTGTVAETRTESPGVTAFPNVRLYFCPPSSLVASVGAPSTDTATLLQVPPPGAFVHSIVIVSPDDSIETLPERKPSNVGAGSQGEQGPEPLDPP
jgi:hypothetical protein